jgi:alcohol dehydrogenase, propanol-preferring
VAHLCCIGNTRIDFTLLVCAIDIDDGKLAHATRLGADFVINAKTEDPAAAVKKATGGGAHGVLITAPSRIAFKPGPGMARKRGTCVLVGLPPGEFPVPLFDVAANCITIRRSFFSAPTTICRSPRLRRRRQVKVDIELQPLTSIHAIFDCLEHGDVPLRAVLDFAPAKTKNQRSELDQHFATTGCRFGKRSVRLAAFSAREVCFLDIPFCRTR